MRTDDRAAISAIRSHAGRRTSAGPTLVLFGALAFAQPLPAADEYVSKLFGTDQVPTEWLITGAGVTDAPATPVAIYPGFISFSSTSFPGGVFIPGASQAAFDGAWNADFSFAIPRRAQNISFQFYDLFADDSVVVLLNDTPIGNSTFYGNTGTYLHQFGPGEDAVPFTFTETTQRTLLGDGNPLFIIGDKDPRGTENRLRLSVNNIVGGIPAPLNSTGDGTAVRMGAAISWTEDYQIRPYPNLSGNVVQVDDDPHGWYNAVNFLNNGAVVVDAGGEFTNRAGASLDSTGSIQNNGQIILGGSYSSLAKASFINNGAISVAGTMDEAGAFINTGTLGLLSTGTFTYRGQGGGDVFVNSGLIYNQGIFSILGPGAWYSGSSTGIQPKFINSGSLVLNGGATATETIDNRGSIFVTGGSVLLGQVNNVKFSEMQLSNGGVFSGGMLNQGDVYVDGAQLVSGPGGKFIGNDGGTINVAAGGTVDIGFGGTLRNEGALGNINLAPGGVLNIARNAFLENLTGTGVISVEGSAEVLGTFRNAGAVIAGNGGQLRLGGESQNTGNIDVGGGSLLEVQAAGHLFAYAPGVINVQAGGILANQGLIEDNTVNCTGGRITGRGTIAASAKMNLDGCTIGPGNSPGTLTILGSLDMNTSTIELEIGSPDDYDRLVTDGPVQMDGTQVAVSFVDGYLPDERDSFAWLSGNNINAVDVSYSAVLPYWIFQFSADGAGAQVSMTSQDAVDLGSGGAADVVNGAGQVAFVDRTGGTSGEYWNEGLLDNGGALHNRQGSVFYNYGSGPGGGTILNRAGAWFVNRGQLTNLFLASVQNSGTFYNHATGVVENQGSFVNTADGRLVNRGRITNGGGGSIFRNEGHLDNRGEIVNGDVIENSGLFEIAAGAAVHGDGSGGTYYSQAGGETRVNGVLNADEIFIFGGRVTGTGVIEGDVSLAQAFIAEGITTGAIDPGDSLTTGTLGITGNLLLQGILHIDLASATLYDVLAVNGALIGAEVPAATLEVGLLGGYRPSLGDGFDYLTALNSASFGQFSNMVLPTLDPGLAWAASQWGDGTIVGHRIEVVAAAVPAPGTAWLLATAIAMAGARAAVRKRG